MLKGVEKEKGLSALPQDKLLRKVGVSEKFCKSHLQHLFPPQKLSIKKLQTLVQKCPIISQGSTNR